MSRNRAMLVGALAIIAVLAAQTTLQGEEIRLGQVLGWGLGGALIGLGVRWYIASRSS